MKIFLILSFLTLLFFPKMVWASYLSFPCADRYVTVINPIRGREFWSNKNISSLIDQYEVIRKQTIPATWLLEYDTLSDQQVLSSIKSFDPKQELGVFLEVSPILAKNSRVIYPDGYPWYSPAVVFLSGYSQSERIKLIDTLFSLFRKTFGYYPKSVGAWWIDSFSLNYLKERYGIEAALIVANQKTTDNYGVWGQWWGVPYYPSKANILSPAGSIQDKQDVVVMQWAQRDPTLAFGEGVKYSNHSLQANDYISLGENTDYFKKLIGIYLSCNNNFGQATVGLETGDISSSYLDEYRQQIEALKQMDNLKFVSMSEFSKTFSEKFPTVPSGFVIGDEKSTWKMTPAKRRNDRLGDLIKYSVNISFKDYFLADRSDFLHRELNTPENNARTTKDYRLVFLILIFFGSLAFAIRRKISNIWTVSVLFCLGAFGLSYRAFSLYGWDVYFGSVTKVWDLVVTLIVLIILFFSLPKLRDKFFTWALPLSFGIDPIIQRIRFSYFSGKYLFGFMMDELRFIGINFDKSLHLEFINKDFPSAIAGALLKFDFSKIWNNLFLSFFAYPMIHIVLAIILSLVLLRIEIRKRKIVLAILTILFAWHLVSIFQTDPRLVIPS